MALTLEEQEELRQLEEELGGEVSSSIDPMMQNSVMVEQIPKTLGQKIYESTVDVLPELGGMAGGTIGALLTKSPTGMTGGAAVGQQAIRSMIGAGVGGATAEAGKQAITGLPSATSLLRSGVEQALYDGVGNLVFTYGGKAFRLAKDQYKSITGKEPPDSAVVAAQELLSKQKEGATLTPFQATGSAWEGFKESVARGSFTGKSVFRRAEQNIDKAIQGAKVDILDDISRNVYDGIVAGKAIKESIKEGEIALKTQVRPFYRALERQGKAIPVDVGPLQAFATRFADEPKALKNLTLAPKEAELLNNLSQLPKNISFSQAHDLLSSFKAQLREVSTDAAPDSRTVARLSQVVQALEKQMDVAGKALNGTALSFDGKIAADGVQTLSEQYKLYSQLYKSGMSDLYSDTVSRLLNKDPEKAGTSIFQNGNVTAFQDVKRALRKAKELNPKLNIDDTINSVRRGYVENLLKSDSFANLGEKITNDPAVRQTFREVLSQNQQKRVLTLINAAKRAQQLPGETAPLFLAAQQAQAVGSVLSVSALALSPDARSLAAKNPEWSLAFAGTLLLGPRFLAKAATSPGATNAALNLVNLQQRNIPLTGPVLAKTLQVFKDAGIQPADLTGETDVSAVLTDEEQQELMRLEQELGQ
jgi:hypothetical protein